MRINLLPDLVLKRRREARIRQIAALALAGWMAALVLLVVFTLGYKAFQDRSLSNSKDKREEVDARVNSEANVAFRKEAKEVQTSLNAITELLARQNRLSVVMKRLAELTPKTARLKDVTVNDQGVITVVGSASSYGEAAKMVMALKNSNSNSNASSGQPYFENVTLVSAARAENGSAFSISAQYMPGSGAATVGAAQ